MVMTEVQSDIVEIKVVEKEEVEVDHDPHYEPIITLPEVIVPTQEEDEMELIKLRAKLFRLDTTEQPPEWKERGTGDVKLLRHGTKNTVRVVMRRDKTLKICANHFVTPHMELKPNCSSDRAWVWSVLADFADEKARSELLAIKFANAENAKKWKEMFEEAKHIVETQCELYTKSVEECIRAHDGYESAASSDSGSEFEDVAETLDQLKLTTNGDQEPDKPDEPTTSPTKANPSEPVCDSSKGGSFNGL